MQEHQRPTPTTDRYADPVSVVEFQHTPGQLGLPFVQVGYGS